MPGNAAIYIADPSLMGTRFFDRIDGVGPYEGINEGGSATGVRFTLEAGEITMNFMAAEQVADHLRGFTAFAQQVIKNQDELIYAQARIYYVRMVCGCIITPDFDEAGTILKFLFQFSRDANGLLFHANTIFDYDGLALGR